MFMKSHSGKAAGYFPFPDIQDFLQQPPAVPKADLVRSACGRSEC
jgi:hypothetical protein